MTDSLTGAPARWQTPGRWWRWGLPAAEVAWTGVLTFAALFRVAGVPLLVSEPWRVALLVLAVAVAVGGLVRTGIAAAHPTLPRAEHTRLIRLHTDRQRRREIERDLRSSRERPVEETMAVLLSSSAGVSELVHAGMITPVAAMVWARTALDETGWLAGASVVIGLLCATSAGYWIRRARQVFRGAARLDVPALVAR